MHNLSSRAVSFHWKHTVHLIIRFELNNRDVITLVIRLALTFAPGYPHVTAIIYHNYTPLCCQADKNKSSCAHIVRRIRITDTETRGVALANGKTLLFSRLCRINAPEAQLTKYFLLQNADALHLPYLLDPLHKCPT